jgi:hypothetical protein
MIIAFYTPHLTFRGSCLALYDYAHYNELFLNNQSIIITPRLHEQTTYDDNQCAFQWFIRRFPVLFYDDIDEIQDRLINRGCTFIYGIKHGLLKMDPVNFTKIPFGVHCVFDMSTPHGTKYMGVSKTVANKYGSDKYVHHMVNMDPKCTFTSLRTQYNIPKDAIVLGRYGGLDTFNVFQVVPKINEIVVHNPNIYFLFMNCPSWEPRHPHIIHISAITNIEFKKRFIKTCDAMIVPEFLGHTFGLSIAEFQVFHKPIICFNGPVNNNAHINILGNNALYFNDATSFHNVINTFKPYKSVNSYARFTPKNAMKEFQQFLD